MSYPRYQLSRQFKKKTRQSTDITFSATSFTAVDTALDIILDAQVGDEIEYIPSIQVASNSGGSGSMLNVDVATVVAGSTVNFWANGGASTGYPAWMSGSVDASYRFAISGSGFYTIVSGDLDTNSRVTLRLMAFKQGTSTWNIYARSVAPLFVFARNLGPSDDD